MARALAVAFLGALCLTGSADAARFEVVVVPSVDIESVVDQAGGAVGLMAPGAGPETSYRIAYASLVRGEVRNSLRGGIPAGRPRIRVSPHARGPAIFVQLPRDGPQSNDDRYPVAVFGHGFHGVLTSPSTHIPGLISVADIAPTALGENGSLGWRDVDDDVGYLRGLDARIRENNSARIIALVVVVVILGGLALVWPRAAVAGFSAVLAANLGLGASGAAGKVVAPLVLGLSALVGGLLLARLPAWLPAAVVVAAYLAVLGLEGTWVSLSPLGPSQNGRFYGLSNLLETLLLVPALVGALALAPLAIVALVAVAGNRFGADGGGAIVLAIAYAVLLAGALGWRRRVAAVALAAAVAVALALVGIDAATGASSHVTNALEGGPREWASDLWNRLAVSYGRATEHWYVALVIAAALIALVELAAKTLARRRDPLFIAFLAAIAVSLIVNDSPLDVSLLGLVGAIALRSSERLRPSAAKTPQMGDA